jgi:hypothetical protein
MEPFLFPLVAALVLVVATLLVLVRATRNPRTTTLKVALVLVLLTLLALAATLVTYAVSGLEVTVTRS